MKDAYAGTRVFHNAVHGWYGIRATGHEHNAGGVGVPMFEYLQRSGTWGLTTEYFEERSDILDIIEGENK